MVPKSNLQNGIDLTRLAFISFHITLLPPSPQKSFISMHGLFFHGSQYKQIAQMINDSILFFSPPVFAHLTNPENHSRAISRDDSHCIL